MTLDISGNPAFDLVWPRELFVVEADALLDRFSLSDAIKLLLTEAFRSPAVSQMLAEGASQRRAFLEELVEKADQLPEAFAVAPYWPQRHNVESPSVESRSAQASADFRAQVIELRRAGYFDATFPDDCAAAQPRNWDISAVLAEKLGVPDLWPLEPSTWSQGTFFGLIEAFHDLAARPRSVIRHPRIDETDCSHFSDFARPIGQKLYRWRMHQMLIHHGLGVRFADDGEDAGRLVRISGDDRDELVQRALATPDAAARDTIRHAIAAFRSPTAGRPAKRSAIVDLALLLEQHRAVIKEKLLTEDESTLFNIANNFALRHHNDKQRNDYDEAFLDWTFWVYLATVELTGHLVHRPTS